MCGSIVPVTITLGLAASRYRKRLRTPEGRQLFGPK